VGGSDNSTIVFPLPIDLIKPLLGSNEGETRRERPARPQDPDRLDPAQSPGELPVAPRSEPERVPSD
jgi:hypothetical protein